MSHAVHARCRIAPCQAVAEPWQASCKKSNCNCNTAGIVALAAAVQKHMGRHHPQYRLSEHTILMPAMQPTALLPGA
jgi:hypothetical protein